MIFPCVVGQSLLALAVNIVFTPKYMMAAPTRMKNDENNLIPIAPIIDERRLLCGSATQPEDLD